MNSKSLRRLLLVLCLCSFALRAYCLGDHSYVSFSTQRGAFALVASGKAVPLLLSDNDWPGVARAAGDLSQDIERVSGIRPELIKAGAGSASVDAVIIGTIGKSALIDDLIQRHKIDVGDVRGKWESAVTTIVEHPTPGIRRALVIAGSDKRGTIFAIYDLSEQIGVSPWYWWADVRIPHHGNLFVVPGRYVQPVPAVKYRGIFLNDEAPALSGWGKEKFGGLNSKFYVHVFELLLRLKANYLWPAMWDNAFNEDDPENPRLADMYGIVMGTSHHEPMLRSQQEWKRHGTGAWNYETNGAELRSFWKDGIDRNKDLESTVTVGMRGDGDMPMSTTDNVGLLEKIVHDQLDILKDESTPTLDSDLKIWALYKEVQSYYEKGMRVPDNVTLLWSDDNWGDLRRLPTAEERKRSGGAGIYYHFDYVGAPRNYNWINTNSISKVWEQMHLALEYGADRVWIVNVGDLKPMEFPMEFFLTYAREPQRWDQDHLHEFAVDWATRDFGPEHAEEIARDVEDYTRYNSRRKPELINPGTFSVANFDEANRVKGDWEALEKRVNDLAGKLPQDERASYFELVQYMVEASATVTEMYIAAGENALAVRQGRASANDDAARTLALFNRDKQLADEYNHDLLNGKWDHMMDQPHLGYTSWNSPKANSAPRVATLELPEKGELGVAFGDKTGPQIAMDEFDSVARQQESLTLFDKGKAPVAYHVKVSAPWVVLDNGAASGKGASPLDGIVDKQIEIPIYIDWKTAPAGVSQTDIVVSSDAGEVSHVSLTARRQNITRVSTTGFVESDGYVAIEASDISAQSADGEVHWVELPGYGRTKSAMTVFPVTAQSNTSSAASLSYKIHLYDSGPMRLQLILAPTENFVPGRGLRFAVSVDDGPCQIVDALAQNTDRDWSIAVSDNAKKVTVPLTITVPGEHVLKIWYVDPGVVLERLVLSKNALPPSYLGPPESYHWVSFSPK